MSGTNFSKANRPILPGGYFNFEAIQAETVPPALGSTVCVVFTHDWGPFETPVYVDSMAEFNAIYGKSATGGRISVEGAFRGEGTQGRGGAGTVLCYRHGGSAAAKATKTLSNVDETPETAIVLTARYEGSYGNNLKVSVTDTAGDANYNDLILYIGTLEVERYTHLNADIPGLIAAINAESNYVTAAAGAATDVALWASDATDNETAVAFTGGNDGSTLAANDYTAAMAAVEVERFSVLAFENITPNGDSTDNGILTSLVSWADALNDAGKRFITVVGGQAADSVSTANTRSALISSENFINLGVGTYDDEVYGTLTTSKLAGRVAGIVAQRGESDSLTYARLAGLTIISGPTESQKLSAFQNGTLVIGRDSDARAPVRLERGVTTYTTTTDDNKPYLIFRNPKFIRTMQGIQMELTEWVESNIIGKVPVNDKTRAAVRAEIISRLNQRVDAGAIQPNPTVTVDTDPPPSDDDEFLAFVVGVRWGRSAEQVFFTIRNG